VPVIWRACWIATKALEIFKKKRAQPKMENPKKDSGSPSVFGFGYFPGGANQLLAFQSDSIKTEQ
jgi:hypothetical protein